MESFGLKINDVQTVVGRGIVVTGIVSSGTLKVKDNIIIENRQYKVGQIESVLEQQVVNVAKTGMKVSVCVMGAKANELTVGSWITKPSEPIDEAELEKILLENFGEKQSENEASMASEKDSEPDCPNETIFGVVKNIADKNTDKVKPPSNCVSGSKEENKMRKLMCEMCGSTQLRKQDNCYICDVCGAEFTYSEQGQDKPEKVVFDFSYEEKECILSVQEWLIESDYVPEDILAKAKINPLKRVYLPMYLFVGDYTANWSADSGYNREEIYTDYEKVRKTVNGNVIWVREPVTKKRTVTDWHPSSGTVSDRFTQFSIGTNKVKQDLKNYLETNIALPKSYVPLDSFDKEGKNLLPYEFDKYKAYQLIAPRLNQEIKNKVVGAIPGDTYRNPDWSSDATYDTVELYYPVYLGSYKYNGATYSFIADGTNPDILCGKRPEDNDKLEKAKKTITPLKYLSGINNVLILLGFIICCMTEFSSGKFWVIVSAVLVGISIYYYKNCYTVINQISTQSKAKRLMLLNVLHDASLTESEKENKIKHYTYSNDIVLSPQDMQKIKSLNNDNSTNHINYKIKDNALTFFIVSAVLPGLFAIFGVLIWFLTSL